MKPAQTDIDFLAVEWGWSFWLIVLLPAIVAFFAGLYSGVKTRSFRSKSSLFFVHVLCLSILFYFLWTFHIERIDQAKVDYFMKHENPAILSLSEPPPDEPVYDDWRTTGNKGFYVKCQDDNGALYVRPPHWVLLVAPFYCAAFWVAGFLLLSTRRNYNP